MRSKSSKIGEKPRLINLHRARGDWSCCINRVQIDHELFAPVYVCDRYSPETYPMHIVTCEQEGYPAQK